MWRKQPPKTKKMSIDFRLRPPTRYSHRTHHRCRFGKSLRQPNARIVSVVCISSIRCRWWSCWRSFAHQKHPMTLISVSAGLANRWERLASIARTPPDSWSTVCWCHFWLKRYDCWNVAMPPHGTLMWRWNSVPATRWDHSNWPIMLGSIPHGTFCRDGTKISQITHCSIRYRCWTNWFRRVNWAWRAAKVSIHIKNRWNPVDGLDVHVTSLRTGF